VRPGPKSLVGLGSPASFRGPLAALSKGGGVYPPSGHAFLLWDDGSHKILDDGSYKITEAY
jgi:hypothetical protein